MEEKEYSNIYAIPANYTDSGKLMGGMVETRCAVEAIFLVGLVGYPELFWIPMPTTIRIVCMTVTLLPLGVVALMGADGGSLLQYLWNIICFFSRIAASFIAGGLVTIMRSAKSQGQKSKSLILSRTISESGI